MKECSENRANKIAFLGSYIDRKGVKTLKKSAVKLMEQYSEVHFGFFGVGVTAELILKDYPEKFHNRITIISSFENSELPELLAEYGVLAFPSLSEGFPLVGLEAMACGLVPVSSDIPGPTEYIDDRENGLLFPLESSDALYHAFCELINDGGLYARLRKNALDTVPRFSWNKVAMHQEKIYLSLLARISS